MKKTLAKLFQKGIWLSLVILGSTIYPAFAGEKEDEIVSKLVEAYGGEKLLQLNTFASKDVYALNWAHSDRIDGRADIRIYKNYFAVDLENQVLSRENWQIAYGIHFHSLRIAEKDNARFYDFRELEVSDEGDFANEFFFFSLTSTPMMVYSLTMDGVETVFKGQKNYNGIVMNVLEVSFKDNLRKLKIYINSETGLISHHVRETNEGTLSFFFGDYTATDGIQNAGTVSFLRKDAFTVVRQLADRRVFVNQPIGHFFDIPTDFQASKERERIDDSAMVVRKEAENVFFAGQGPGFSIFVDAGDYIIASGGYKGLKDRFEAFEVETGIDKPLRYQIVTHHHFDHLGGMKDALDLGATIVTPRANVLPVIEEVGELVPYDRFLIVEENSITLGDEESITVSVYRINTPHADNMLFVYVPKNKIGFIADHYASPFTDGYQATRNLHRPLLDEIERVGIEVEKFLAAHVSRSFTKAELENIAAGKIAELCYQNRPICSN